MSLSLALICLWVVAVFLLSALPSKDKHWRLAYVLIGTGIPLLIWITWRDGPLMGLLGLSVGCLILRWPVRFLWRWVRGKLAR